MKLWLIEIIHNFDMLCNTAFWFLTITAFIAFCASRNCSISINRKLLRIWQLSALGVLFIPSKATLTLLILRFPAAGRTATARRITRHFKNLLKRS
ncbi:MAG: hypothetical protein Q4B82_09125 [Alysiella sp.]|uniref:hypothetical protein n=1 Tax=Alysiella sp. TaxID=1872483 RepID=UPI0026DC1F1D|nr:hypothetical protein [Alysiella sp.]MDO4434722.1 hypothetical protein [Alysiella sp.]